jgi:hypothetical protein
LGWSFLNKFWLLVAIKINKTLNVGSQHFVEKRCELVELLLGVMINTIY